MRQRDRWLSTGLFLTTLATLLLELLDSRLLSVLTWYHLSFLAVSLAMLGGAAGAVLVFLWRAGLAQDAARRALGPVALLLAIAIPSTQLALMRMRIPPLLDASAAEALPLAGATLLLTIPFLLSGAVVSLALTRCGGRVGILYGSDLVGAALGCLAIVPVLHFLDMFSAGLLAGALVAAGSWCFSRVARAAGSAASAAVALALALASLAHVGAGAPIGVAYPRGNAPEPGLVDVSRWNSYSFVSVLQPVEGPPFYWGRGASPPSLRTTASLMRIDGAAGTALTAWDGRRSSLDWVQYDVTSLPYQLRAGDAAVIGVGGGRDVLSALWAGSDTVTGVELNEIFVDLLQHRYRDFAGIAGRPGVRLVNEEGRSFLSRTKQQYDVLQMSLVDTWAATGAGAFTLTENGLYTTEAWKLFLSRLKPNGIFSTSRWFSPENVSETSRLLSLCVRTLLELGVSEPARHVALVSRNKVATLLVSREPLSDHDLVRIRRVARRYEFSIHALPGAPPTDPRLSGILAATSVDELDRAVRDPDYDYSAPNDDRPFFFNMLRPASFHRVAELSSGDVLLGKGGVIWGNLRATATLVLLLAIALVLTAVIVFVPLAAGGLPDVDRGTFAAAASFFALIGYGFMSIQIPLLQRFSVLLGHPIHTYSVILFSMILFAGVGSFLSERIDAKGQWRTIVPAGIGFLLVVLTLLLQPLCEASLGLPLVVRAALVIACVAPIALLLGCCFPLGMRLVESISQRMAPWMWGVNGAFGVLASIVAVAVSMWFGIRTNLLIAAALYLVLALPARRLGLCAASGPRETTPAVMRVSA